MALLDQCVFSLFSPSLNLLLLFSPVAKIRVNCAVTYFLLFSLLLLHRCFSWLPFLLVFYGSLQCVNTCTNSGNSGCMPCTGGERRRSYFWEPHLACCRVTSVSPSGVVIHNHHHRAEGHLSASITIPERESACQQQRDSHKYPA